MEIIKNFGINPLLIAAEIINFLIIMYVLKKFLYKPIFSILKKREKAIQDGIKNAEESKKKLAEAKVEESHILSNANKKAIATIEEARSEAFEIIQSAQETAKKQAQIALDEARAQIAAEQKLAEKRLFVKMSRVMEEFIEQSLSNMFDKK